MITPMDIHNKTFSKQIRGYSSEEVNSFLEELENSNYIPKGFAERIRAIR